MSSRPCFSETLDRHTHDALYDWARASYGASDDWNTLYLNGLALGRLNPLWRERIKQDWQEGLSEVSDDLCLQTDNWLAMGDSLQHLAHEWKSLGLLHGWRDEKFDVCDDAGKVLFALERAAFRPFGLMSQAVHLNGLVQTDGGWHFWIGRRSPHKAVDPDKLDNLVVGGIASGETPFEAVCRESEEEAGLMPPTLGNLLSRRPNPQPAPRIARYPQRNPAHLRHRPARIRPPRKSRRRSRRVRIDERFATH